MNVNKFGSNFILFILQFFGIPFVGWLIFAFNFKGVLASIVLGASRGNVAYELGLYFIESQAQKWPERSQTLTPLTQEL